MEEACAKGDSTCCRTLRAGSTAQLTAGFIAPNYNYFRDYDPQTGRYVESDPIGLGGGVNTYTYVGNDPLDRVDPSGNEGVLSSIADFLDTADREVFTPLGPAGGVEHLAEVPLVAGLRGLAQLGNAASKEAKAAQLAKNVAQGAKAEKAAVAKLGEKVAGQRVTLESSTTGKKSVADIVSKDKTVTEVKLRFRFMNIHGAHGCLLLWQPVALNLVWSYDNRNEALIVSVWHVNCG